MKNKIINLFIIILFIFLLIETITNKTLISNTINYSLNLWVKNIIPSMFPFFIISDILIQYHITNYIPNILKKTFSKILKINNNILTIITLSIISGFPNSARIINQMYTERTITKEEANNTLLFTHFSNPIFILSTVALFFLHNEKYGKIILISHYLGNIIIAIIINNNNTNKTNYTKKTVKSQNFTKVLINSIKSTIDSLLTILGTITVFLILANILTNKLNLSPYTSSIIKGLLEITSGIYSLSQLTIPNIYKVTISTMFISFGGLSVHLQILSQLTNVKINYHKFLIARIFHSLISGLLAYLLFEITF